MSASPHRNRLTAARQFFAVSPDDNLFSVRPGISAQDALNAASCFLGCSVAVTRAAAVSIDGGGVQDPALVWAASYMDEFAKALVEASLHAPESKTD